jgi:hypothetical protein
MLQSHPELVHFHEIGKHEGCRVLEVPIDTKQFQKRQLNTAT